jgi:hypothetical protein
VDRRAPRRPQSQSRHRFERVDKRFDSLEARFGARFDSVDAGFETRFGHMEARFDRLESRLDFMQRTMVQGVITLTGGMLAGFAAIIALIATQL